MVVRATQKRRFRPRATDRGYLSPMAPNHLEALDAQITPLSATLEAAAPKELRARSLVLLR